MLIVCCQLAECNVTEVTSQHLRITCLLVCSENFDGTREGGRVHSRDYPSTDFMYPLIFQFSSDHPLSTTVLSQFDKLFSISHPRVPILTHRVTNTAQKMKFFIKDFFSKYDQIRSFLRIWSYLLKKSLMKNFIFCAVFVTRCVSIGTLGWLIENSLSNWLNTVVLSGWSDENWKIRG